MSTQSAESASVSRNEWIRVNGSRLQGSAATFWEYLFLLAFTLLLLWPLCTGRALYWGDILLYFAPMLRFQQMTFSQGHIPLWNPTILGGQPLVGNPQMGVFYPTTPLLSLMPVWLYLSVTTIGHVFLCGALMNVYLRQWSGDRWARMAGSLVYMGSECLIGRIQFPPMIFSAPYFPLLLLCIDRCLDTEAVTCENKRANSANACPTGCSDCRLHRSRQIRAHVRLSLVIGLLVLAAHPQMAYLILIAGSLYAMARLWIRAPRQHLRTAFKIALPSACRLVGAGLLGLMLAAAQVVPAIQVLLESPREKLTPMQANRFYLEPTHLLSLVFPRFWGHPTSADFWGGGNAWEPAFFIGWLPLLLIFIACLHLRKRRKVQFWIAAAVGGIWLAFGIMGGAYWLAFKTVPGLSNFHDPARFLIFTTFAFAVLTTLGWRVCGKIVQQKLTCVRVFPSSATPAQTFLYQVSWGRTLRYLGIIGIAWPLWWAGKDWNPTVPHEFYSLTSRALTAVAPTAPETGVASISEETNDRVSRRLYMPAHEQFWKHYVTDGYSDYGPDEARRFQAILDTLMPNLNTASGVESASGYEPVPLSAPLMMDGLARAAIKRGEPNLSRLLAVMGAGTLILPKEDHFSDPRFVSVTSFADPPGQTSALKLSWRSNELPVRVWRYPDALPRAWITRSVRRVQGKTRLSAALTAVDFDPEQTALLQDTPNEYESALLHQLEWPVPITKKELTLSPCIRLQDAHNMELEADCGSEAGFLVISVSAFPGWQAKVDSRRVLLHRADGAAMGLYLPPGKHSVSLRYKPACYQFGLYLSLFAIGTTSAFIGYGKLQKFPTPKLHKAL